MTGFSLFAGADLVGEFDTRQTAERARDEALLAYPSAADELAIVEFDGTDDDVDEPRPAEA